MMTDSHSTTTLDALAALVSSARSDVKLGRWDTQGIRAALIQAGQRPEPITLARLAMAAITCAADPEARTPVRIAHDGPHWEATKPITTTAQVRYVAPTDCGICSQPRHRCELDPSHEYQQRNRRPERATTDQLAAIREQAEAARLAAKATAEEAMEEEAG